MPASTLSHHLKRLVDAGVIRSRGEGTFHYYSVDYDALRKLTDYLWEDCCKNGGGSGGKWKRMLLRSPLSCHASSDLIANCSSSYSLMMPPMCPRTFRARE